MAMQADTDIHQQKGLLIFCLCSENVLLYYPFVHSRQERSMKREENSSVSEFLLRGLPIRPEQQGAFFALFLGVYLTTVLGNLLILLLIRLDPRLHTPMYFFLSHLAFTDVSFSSVTVPKMLINMQTQH